jgi:hypothetical protein
MGPPAPAPELQPLRPGGRSIGPRLAALGVATLAVGVVGIGLVGDPGIGRPAQTDASRQPSSAASSARAGSPTPVLTALPTIQVGAGDAGEGRLLILFESGYRLLDRSSGRAPSIGPYQGRMLAIPGGGWLCVCTEVLSSPGGEEQTYRLIRIGADARADEPVFERVFVGTRSEHRDPAISADAVVSDDGRTAVFGWVARQPDGSWRLELETVALSPGGRTTAALVAQLPPDEAVESVAGPLLGLAPDGRSIVAGAWSFSADDPSPLARWVVDLDAPGESAGRPLVEIADLVDCGVEGWAGSSLYVAVCGTSGPWPATAGWVVARWGRDGTPLDRIDLREALGDLPVLSPHVDPAAGRLWLWDGWAHRLVRVDAASGQVDVGPLGGGPPDWPANVDPIGPSLGSPRALVALGATRRVYAIGQAVEPGGTPLEAPRVRSTGVWVFDADSLRLVDHWPATAQFSEITASPDGREIVATGMAQVDADGFPRPTQEASITAFDSLTGEVRLIAGQLGSWVAQP